MNGRIDLPIPKSIQWHDIRTHYVVIVPKTPMQLAHKCWVCKGPLGVRCHVCNKCLKKGYIDAPLGSRVPI